MRLLTAVEGKAGAERRPSSAKLRAGDFSSANLSLAKPQLSGLTLWPDQMRSSSKGSVLHPVRFSDSLEGGRGEARFFHRAGLNLPARNARNARDEHTNKFSQSTNQAVDAISQDVPGAGNKPAIRVDYTLFWACTQA